jgi:hypothetical protein
MTVWGLSRNAIKFPHLPSPSNRHSTPSSYFRGSKKPYIPDIPFFSVAKSGKTVLLLKKTPSQGLGSTEEKSLAEHASFPKWHSQPS